MRCCGKGFQIPGQIGLQRLHCTIFRQQSIVCCREYSKIKQYSQIKCTRSYDSVGTLYANRHFTPINRTRSRPSRETLYTGCIFLALLRDLVHRVHLPGLPVRPCRPSGLGAAFPEVFTEWNIYCTKRNRWQMLKTCLCSNQTFTKMK